MSYAMITIRSALLAIAVSILALTGALADEGGWRVGKVSGEVWFGQPGVQAVALTRDSVLEAGGTVRTGQDGRVLLTRGAETILVSPNTSIALSKDSARSMTTVLQQAGSILLDVEKRNHRHFEIATPHLAAVVKGTKFNVIVDDFGSRVGVRQGEVEVTDYASGQHVLLRPDQQASVSLQGPGGITLGGSGKMNPVRQGTPRTSPVRTTTISAGLRTGIPAVDGERTAASATAPAGSAERATPARPRAVEERTFTGIVMDWSGLGGKRRTFDKDDIAIAAVPGLVGVSVAIGVTAFRWRRRRSEKKQKKAGK